MKEVNIWVILVVGYKTLALTVQIKALLSLCNVWPRVDIEVGVEVALVSEVHAGVDAHYLREEGLVAVVVAVVAFVALVIVVVVLRVY